MLLRGVGTMGVVGQCLVREVAQGETAGWTPGPLEGILGAARCLVVYIVT